MNDPTYPVEVELVGHDGNAFSIIGRVAQALRREVSVEASDEYAKAAMDCGSYDKLIAYTMATVHVT